LADGKIQRIEIKLRIQTEKTISGGLSPEFYKN